MAIKRQRAFVLIHGTNGMRKSTLVRWLLMCSHGIRECTKHPKVAGGKVTHSYDTLSAIGWYRSPAGGADGVQPYSLVPATIKALIDDGRDVVCEGLISPGIGTCIDLTEYAKAHGYYVRFIRLDLGYWQAVRNVERRRQLRGQLEPLDPTNLRAKQVICNGWLERLARNKLPIYGLDWKQSCALCMQVFGLSTENATRLLD